MDDWVNEFTFLDEAYVQKRFALFPHKCHQSNKWIWLEFGFRARRSRAVPSGLMHEDHWYTPVEYTMLKLKGA